MDAKRNQSTAKINDCSFCHVYCQPRAVVDYTISTAAIWMSDKLLEASQIDLPARVLLCVCVFVISFCPIWCLTVFFYTYLLLKFIHAFALYDARSFILNECFCHAAHRGRWQLLSVETVSTSNYIAECGGTMNICNIKVWQSECMISLCIIGKVWRQQNGPKSMGQWGNGAGSRDRCQTRRSTHWTMYIRPWCRSASGRREHSSTP